MTSSLDIDTILKRLRENDTSLRFLLICPPCHGQAESTLPGAPLSFYLEQYYGDYLSKSGLIEHLSTLFDIRDPIFIETIDFDQLFTALSTNTALNHLVIGASSISDPQIAKLSQWLASNPGLVTLSILGSQISPFGGCKIAESLRTNSTLTSLNLSSNFVKEGAMAIGESLRTNSTLTSLDLSLNSVKEGAMAIGKSLRSNSTLTSLNLSYNSIEKEAAIAIGESLRTNSTLTLLDLSYNPVKEGAMAIGKSLRTNSTLTSLDLSGNSIEKEGLIAFANSLSFNYSLTSLDIADNDLSPVDTKIIESQLHFRSTLHNRFTTPLSSHFPQFNSLSILASSDERATLTQLYQALYKQCFRQSLVEYQNICSLNEIKQRQNPRNDLILELNGLLAATPLNPQAILTRLQEMSASVDELYRSPLPPSIPTPSSSFSSSSSPAPFTSHHLQSSSDFSLQSSSPHPQPSSSSSPLPSSSTLSSYRLPSPSSSSTFEIDAFVALQNQLVFLVQAVLDRYPTILSELRQQEAAVRSLGFEEYAQRVSSTISPIRDNGAAQMLMTEAITKMNRSLDLSLKTVQSQIRKIEEEARLLRSVLNGIPQVLPLIESRIKEVQELRASMTVEHEAEVVQLKNVLGRCAQSLATLYRQQIKFFEEDLQSIQTNRARSSALGLVDRTTRLDQDIADVEVQLQTPRSLLEQVTQLAAGYGVTTAPPTMCIDELRRIGALAHFELDQSHIELGDLIGDGGMGQVFQGSFYGTPVAIKRLKNQDFLAVQKEVKNWCHFHHPHILPFIGYTQNALIVMELMDKPLADILHRKSTLLGKSPTLDEPPLTKISFDQRFRMIWCIASGLCYLHTKEMVHRDIKSLNILVRGFVEGDMRFDIKIADFGATRSLVTLGQTTVGIKTPRWAAPELYETDGITTFKSDVFAYAMVMYEILTRRLPFDELKTELGLAYVMRREDRPAITLDHDLDGINPAKVNALVELMKEGWNEDQVTRPSALVILQKLRDIQKFHNIVNNEDLDMYETFEFSAADTSHSHSTPGTI